MCGSPLVGVFLQRREQDDKISLIPRVQMPAKYRLLMERESLNLLGVSDGKLPF